MSERSVNPVSLEGVVMFKHLIVTSIVVSVVGSAGILRAAGNEMTISVQPASSREVVLYGDGMDGRLLAVTDQSGRGSFDTEFVNNPKGKRARVLKCGERVGIVVDGTKPPSNCSKKDLAPAFLWGSAESVAANLGAAAGGIGTTGLVAI